MRQIRCLMEELETRRIRRFDQTSTQHAIEHNFLATEMALTAVKKGHYILVVRRKFYIIGHFQNSVLMTE